MVSLFGDGLVPLVFLSFNGLFFQRRLAPFSFKDVFRICEILNLIFHQGVSHFSFKGVFFICKTPKSHFSMRVRPLFF
jgi:hypothetical protein